MWVFCNLRKKKSSLQSCNSYVLQVNEKFNNYHVTIFCFKWYAQDNFRQLWFVNNLLQNNFTMWNIYANLWLLCISVSWYSRKILLERANLLNLHAFVFDCFDGSAKFWSVWRNEKDSSRDFKHTSILPRSLYLVEK